MEAGRITTLGAGKGSPVASNDTAAGRQQNRRVEVIISNPALAALSLPSEKSQESPRGITPRGFFLPQCWTRSLAAVQCMTLAYVSRSAA